jgi:hypothetical protein
VCGGSSLQVCSTVASTSAAMPRATRTARASAAAVAVEPTPTPVAEQPRPIAKRKRRASITNADQLKSQTVELQADKENVLVNQEAAMKLVADAYAHTLKQHTQSITALSEGMDGMQVENGAKKSATRKAPAKRKALQQRDENAAAPAVEIDAKPTALVLSPRTLLVPSILPEMTITELELPPAIITADADSLVCTETMEDDAEASPASAPIALAPDAGSKRIDSTHALPAPYVTINPDLLRDAAWQFRDLQLLCMRLGLGGRGTRSELVERLLAWHRKCFHKKQSEAMEEDEEDDHPLSISKRMKHASNFSLLQFDTSAMLQATSSVTPPPAASSTPPLSPFNDDHANGPLASVTVSASLPQLLTPLLYRTARKHDGTPRSILSPSMRPKSSTKRLSFSVFNGVKLIPDRHTSNDEMNTSTPSPTKKLVMDDADDDAPSPIRQPDIAPAAVVESAPAPSPSKPSFLSSVSAAIMTALTPRKAQQQQQAPPAYPPHLHSTAFTFERLPSIEAHHGDESEADTSMEE